MFCLIAMRGETTHSELKKQFVNKQLGLSEAAVSRTIARLGDGIPMVPGRRAVKGLKWVESYEDPLRRTEKRVKLTRKGKELAHALIEVVRGKVSHKAA